MADEQDGEEKEQPTIASTEPYETNEEAFEDAWKVAEAFSRRFFLSRAPKGNELTMLIRAYQLRLRRSPDHIHLARLVREHRLTPDRLAVILLVLQDNYVTRGRTIGEVFVTAVAFNPPRINQVWRWVLRSPHLVGIGPRTMLHPGPELLRQVEGGAPIGEADFFAFVRLVEDLETNDRADIPDNRGRQKHGRAE